MPEMVGTSVRQEVREESEHLVAPNLKINLVTLQGDNPPPQSIDVAQFI